MSTAEAILLATCATAPFLGIMFYATYRDRMGGFYRGWDPDRDWSTRGAPFTARRREWRQEQKDEPGDQLTPGQEERLAITRAFLNDPTYDPRERRDR